MKLARPSQLEPIARFGTAPSAHSSPATAHPLGALRGRGGSPDRPPLVGARALLKPRSVILLVAAVVAVAAAWLMPLLAVVALWPLLFVVPGWLLVARAAPRICAPGRFGAGAVVTVYLAAHLVNVVATLTGRFDRTAVFEASGVLGLASLVLAAVPVPGLAPPPRFSAARIRASLRRDWQGWVVGLLAFAVVGVVLGLSAWHQTAAGWVSGGWNWSDFLVHVSIGKSLLYGNFPPQVPYFSGVPLTYHWFGDFHGAIATHAAGVDLIAVFVGSNAFMAGVLALVVWELARSLTGSRRVALIAALLAVFGGGLGWIRLPMDISKGTGDVFSLLAANPYDNTWASDWPWFRIASVFGTGLVPHRATAFGLPGLVAVVLLVRHSLGRRPAGMALAGVVAALLAPFHFYAFPASYLVVLLYALTARVWRMPGWPRDAALFLAPGVLALPFVVAPLLQQEAHGAVRPVAGWSEARFGDGPLAVVFFYVTNLGLPFVLAAGALLFRPIRSRPFLALWVLALFLVPNLIVLSVVEFDMNKYFQMMWIAVAILAASLLARWPRPVAAAAVLVAAISPALVGIWHVASGTVALTAGQERAAAWIEANTPERAVFVTDAFINSAVDLAGRLRITTFGPYAANLGYDPDPREQDVQRVRCDGPESAAQVMAKYSATYVLSSGGVIDCGSAQPTDLSSSALFETVYDAGGVTIWKLRSAG